MRGIYYTNRLVTILVLSVTMIACASSAAAPAPPIDQDKAISSFSQLLCGLHRLRHSDEAGSFFGVGGDRFVG